MFSNIHGQLFKVIQKVQRGLEPLKTKIPFPRGTHRLARYENYAIHEEERNAKIRVLLLRFASQRKRDNETTVVEGKGWFVYYSLLVIVRLSFVQRFCCYCCHNKLYEH